ncbi:glycosyltransferase family 2 protein [Nocardioides pocheonensis]|uniref:glycosyltransferase family 2 protein n=1 Tax=Nocardioides pocheonensis TaxID=661485 RepID=UPI00160E53D6|nr:glycosyltransferase family 2 protein [Nocardioides pocheonensis]
MSALIAQLLVTALALAVAATASLFVGRAARPRLRNGYRALLGAGLAAGTALAGGALGGAGPWRSLVVATVLALAVAGFGPSARPWVLRGLLAWSLTVVAAAAYLASVALWIAESGLGPAALVGGALLWVLQLFLCLVALAQLWETVEALARWDWQRRGETDREVAAASGRRSGPFVSLHLPTHHEPPELVIETLRHLLELEYDDLEVLVVDHGTDDPELWRPVERFCRADERLGFFHLDDRPGHRSRALNVALEKVDPRTQLVGVLEAGLEVEPDFLSRCVPLFADEDLAFVQTSRDHRSWNLDPYFRGLDRFHAASCDVPQRSRNERDSAMFTGAMGLVSRDALVEAGGWDELCATEAPELGLRLLQAGWSGLHVDRSFGRWTMPPTFEALKRQRYRWCLGGVQVLRRHWRSLLPGSRTETNRLTPAQRWTHLAGGLRWFGDLAALLLTVLLLVGALDALAGDGRFVRRFGAPLLLGVFCVFLTWARSVALLRRTTGTGRRGALGAFGLSLALGWVGASASVRAALAREPLSLPTPEPNRAATWRASLRGNLVETGLAALCLAGGLAGLAAAATGSPTGLGVGLLLLAQGVAYAAAPLSSLAAARAELTPELRRLREMSPVRTRLAPGGRRRRVGPVLVAGAATVAVLLVGARAGAPPLGGPPGTRHDSAGTSAHVSAPALGPTPSVGSPLSPLSPLLTSRTTRTSPPATSVPVPGTTALARPTPTRTPTTPVALTSQPTPTLSPTRAHGRPTTLPTKPPRTKKPH